LGGTIHGELEIKELGHIHLSGIALMETWDLKASFNQFQNRGVVCDRT